MLPHAALVANSGTQEHAFRRPRGGNAVHAALLRRWPAMGVSCHAFSYSYLPFISQVYSPLVSTFTLKTNEPPSKWVLASAALLLQDEQAA